MKNITVNCDGVKISNKEKICLIAGPCQLENEQHALDMAGKISEISKKYNIGFIYKTSFDNANRTSLKSKRGAGLEKSLPIFDKIKKQIIDNSSKLLLRDQVILFFTPTFLSQANFFFLNFYIVL